MTISLGSSVNNLQMCIYLLKETIDYYKRHNTTLFISFIDASNAFDRSNHWTLFHKLITRGVPVYIVRILSFWYSMQRMKVSWGDYVTEPFYVTNGVKQGGIVYHLHFLLYIWMTLVCDCQIWVLGPGLLEIY